MRSLYNSFIIAVSIYSRIPMPKVEWSQKNMKYTLCFFPVIGVVIGALFYAWGRICMACGFGQVCFALFGTVIPIAVTGGVHLDGFMDTADALHSSEKKEKKLAIKPARLHPLVVCKQIQYINHDKLFVWADLLRFLPPRTASQVYAADQYHHK